MFSSAAEDVKIKWWLSSPLVRQEMSIPMHPQQNMQKRKTSAKLQDKLNHNGYIEQTVGTCLHRESDLAITECHKPTEITHL